MANLIVPSFEYHSCGEKATAVAELNSPRSCRLPSPYSRNKFRPSIATLAHGDKSAVS